MIYHYDNFYKTDVNTVCTTSFWFLDFGTSSLKEIRLQIFRFIKCQPLYNYVGLREVGGHTD